MYEYIPPQNHKNALNVILLLALGGTVLLAAGTLLEPLPLPSLWQFGGIAAWTFGIFVYTRYVAKGYAYGVTRNEDGSCDCLVSELARKSRVTVCRLSVTGIEEIVAVSRGEKEKKKRLMERLRTEGRRIFDYSAELFPAVKYYVLAEECGELFAVAIAADEKLLRLLTPSQNETKEGKEED